ncbi:hypothetical protein M407DRAFT_25344 [Tulasnella calospora MUT 4182]|uniref:Uncharacterized protein n=1 Tax=Tulasnella calospora MUT 4182 TaxID=1051891 RepID=A0A0C3LVE4_9AGAM|nr:hypothetical protein M407DRAFT_25344 [Tulasnella calospora MUT 4182]
MPHKRLKQSARIERRNKLGFDRPPTKEKGDSMSKKMAWITNAEEMREQLKQLKRKREEEEEGIRPPKRSRGSAGDGEAGQPTAVKIKPGESMRDFNRRVEEEFKWKMQGVYKQASKGGGGKKRKAAKQDAQDNPTGSSITATTSAEAKPSTGKGKTEFERRVDRRSVNDVAEAPPTLTALPRGAAAAAGKSGKASAESQLPVSAVQKRMMEEEREKAIERYRELKRLKTQQKTRLDLV